ncbi:MAG: serine hydrolase domain-containing protein, partial [Alteriqipengyuania sp.]
MTKHFPLVGALALALSACASGPTADTRAVTASVPTNPLPVVGAEVLFWDDATRSARFRSMETYFPGQEVQESPDPRFLPQGDPLPANTQAAIRASMAENSIAGVIVLQDGKVRFEDYALGFGPEGRWTSFSVAKSFTSTLLGAAVKDGFIDSLDDPVSKYVPGLEGSAYD